MSNVTPVATKFGPGQLKVNTCEMNDTRWDNMVQQLQRLFYRSVYIYSLYKYYIYMYSTSMMVLPHPIRVLALSNITRQTPPVSQPMACLDVFNVFSCQSIPKSAWKFV